MIHQIYVRYMYTYDIKDMLKNTFYIEYTSIYDIYMICIFRRMRQQYFAPLPARSLSCQVEYTTYIYMYTMLLFMCISMCMCVHNILNVCGNTFDIYDLNIYACICIHIYIHYIYTMYTYLQNTCI